MSAPPACDARILILLNPGRQSRHYLTGMAAGARRAGIPCLTLELGPIWHAAAGTNAASIVAQARRQILDLVRAKQITHVIGYVFNGTHDLGLTHDTDGTSRTVWDEAGVRHILLWTDHPEWAMQGCALDPPLRDVLGGRHRSHIVKSPSAAEEASRVLGWPGVRALSMAEDFTSPAPVGVERVHDVVAIVGDAAAAPTPTLPFLDDADPDPMDIDSAMRPHAERAWSKLVGDGHDELLRAWLDAKQQFPVRSFWRLAGQLGTTHADSLSWLAAEPRRWYGAVQALRRMVGWRRNFWLTWLGRRVNLGLYGSSAASMGIPQTPEAAGWVAYDRQPAIYARGCVALNINAAHDEEGLTHKPFQIAASGVACIHHDTAGLEDFFRSGEEVVSFRRGPELLDAVRTLVSDAARRARIGEAMRQRAVEQHSWGVRLREILSGSGLADVRVAPAAAA